MQLIPGVEAAQHDLVALCVVCGKPAVNPISTKDVSIRRKQASPKKM